MNRHCGRRRVGGGMEARDRQSTGGETLAATTRMEVVEKENVAVFEIYFEKQSGGSWENCGFVIMGRGEGRKESKVTPGLLAGIDSGIIACYGKD